MHGMSQGASIPPDQQRRLTVDPLYVDRRFLPGSTVSIASTLIASTSIIDHIQDQQCRSVLIASASTVDRPPYISNL